MHAYLITTAQPITLTDLVNQDLLPQDKPHPDIYTAPETGALGIDLVRGLEQFLRFSPNVYDTKYIVILNAVRLTLPAQNAFLKTLEEPPLYAKFLLTVRHSSQLLPTLVSRCFVSPLNLTTSPPPAPADQAALVTPLNQTSLPKRLKLAQPFATKESALTLTSSLITALRNDLHQNPSQSTTAGLDRLTQAHYRLDHNAHPLLTIENLFLHW